jgi:hypothetical protein
MMQYLPSFSSNNPRIASCHLAPCLDALLASVPKYHEILFLINTTFVSDLHLSWHHSDHQNQELAESMMVFAGEGRELDPLWTLHHAKSLQGVLLRHPISAVSAPSWPSASSASRASVQK